MKHSLLIVVIAFALLMILVIVESPRRNPFHGRYPMLRTEGYDVNDTTYHNGELLYPDYVHPETLIVVKADSLNWSMKSGELESDSDIMNALKMYCKPLNK